MQTEILLLRLLASFLGECPHPVSTDWLRLVESHPDHAATIAEFALTYADRGHVSLEHIPASWRSSAGLAGLAAVDK